MKNMLKYFDFGNEAGDDMTKQELQACFVTLPSCSAFLNLSKNFVVASAKKGIGKSALIQYLYWNILDTKENALVIRCRGAELTRSCFNLTTSLDSPNDYIRDWMVRLCTMINREIAKNINFALTSDEITLVESAEIDGFKSKNLVGCLISRFKSALGKMYPEKESIKDQVEMLKKLDNKNEVWILIDDLDATFQNTEKERLTMSTFFSACRYLLQDNLGLNIRVTMRSDVWPIIRRYDESLDKLDQYVHEIEWDVDDFRKFLYKRIESHLLQNAEQLPYRRNDISDEEYEEFVIEKIFDHKTEWGGKEQYLYRIVYTLSYMRPRWAIQLCKLCQKNANRRNMAIITKQDVDEVWGDYGQKRVADLVIEHRHQCRQIESIIYAFRGCKRLFGQDELFSHINRSILNHVQIIIDDSKTTSAKDVARFLFRTGFIVARSDGENGDYQHYSFREMPELLASNTSNDYGVKWEIHPCYRQALDIKKIDQAKKIKMGRSHIE